MASFKNYSSKYTLLVSNKNKKEHNGRIEVKIK